MAGYCCWAMIGQLLIGEPSSNDQLEDGSPKMKHMAMYSETIRCLQDLLL